MYTFIIGDKVNCHATNSPPKIGPPGVSGNIYCHRWSPWTKYGCHRWSLRTICGAVGGPPYHKWSPLNYPYRNDVCKGTVGRVTNNDYYSLIASCSI